MSISGSTTEKRRFDRSHSIHIEFHRLSVDLAMTQSLTRPISSGYALALSLQTINMNSSVSSSHESRSVGRLRQNRMLSSVNLPTQDQLKKLKQQKKVCSNIFMINREEKIFERLVIETRL